MILKEIKSLDGYTNIRAHNQIILKKYILSTYIFDYYYLLYLHMIELIVYNMKTRFSGNNSEWP